MLLDDPPWHGAAQVDIRMRRVALSIVRFAESKFGAGKSRLVVAAFMFLRCLLPSGSARRG
jgi:hypothetical protein